MRNLKVLIVEDEVIIRKYIMGILESLGCDIVGECSSGESAIEISAEYRPDLIFMDIKLDGEMSGIDAASRISLDMNIPVAFISAYNYEKNNIEKEVPLCAGYFHKPIEIASIRPFIEKMRTGLNGAEIAR